MKRGLKGETYFRPVHELIGCRVFPDEEGTESCCASCSGTRERAVAEYSPMKRGLKVRARCLGGVARWIVAEYSPMKRGLKGRAAEFDKHVSALVAEYSPMKRGLKAAEDFIHCVDRFMLQSIPR